MSVITCRCAARSAESARRWLVDRRMRTVPSRPVVYCEPSRATRKPPIVGTVLIVSTRRPAKGFLVAADAGVAVAKKPHRTARKHNAIRRDAILIASPPLRVGDL